jgi:TRAP transporter TAXI family solute receptor
MTIRIGTSEYDGTFYSQGGALKVILERQSELAPVERLQADQIEFGSMASNWIGRAKNGEAPFARPIDLAMAAPMNAGPLFFVVRAESPIRSFAGLRGRRVAVGPRASGMVQHAHGIFGALAMSFSDFTPVYLDFAAGAEALAAGEIDAQFQCPVPNAIMTGLARHIGLRVLSYERDELERVVHAVPYYRRTVMRKGAIRGLDVDVPQIAVVNVLVSHRRVSEATVCAAVEAIVASWDELGRINPLFLDMGELFRPLRSQGRGALEFGGVSLHPGALLAYRNAGLLT